MRVRLEIVECVGDACDCGRMADHGHCGARARAAERHIRGRHPTAVGARLPCDRSRRLHPTIMRCTLVMLPTLTSHAKARIFGGRARPYGGPY